MDKRIEKLKTKLAKCRSIINRGYTSTRESGLPWLNTFCAEFLCFTNKFHKLISTQMSDHNAQDNEHVQIMFLCLTQIVTCIKHMERTIKAEESGGVAISASRQYFLDRINWCLERLQNSMRSFTNYIPANKPLEENNFVELTDMLFDYLTPYCQYQDGGGENVSEDNAEAMFNSAYIRSLVDVVLGHTLAFANVAMEADKKALSALCQKVLRECISFQQECALNEQNAVCNDSNRKLKATSLRSAIYQLEDYLNESLLRLVFKCFLDFGKLSIERLRAATRQSANADDSAVDDLIADFDVNMDRTTQIGIFAIAFAPNIKVKTAVRSSLASFESLEMYLIPSLYEKTSSVDVFSEILEQHFNEEVANFRLAVQEIIDSYAFTSCYQDMLSDCLTQAEKKFNKSALEDAARMGQYLINHFQLHVNYKDLSKSADSQRLLEKFTVILRECQAILMCAEQVDVQRILKRFKILRSVLRRFLDSIGDISTVEQSQNLRGKSFDMLTSDDVATSRQIFESAGISPSVHNSILYGNVDTPIRRRCASDSLKGNYSKLLRSPSVCQPQVIEKKIANDQDKCTVNDLDTRTHRGDRADPRRASVRRKSSLRTTMFKRQKSMETEMIYNIYKNNSSSLHITEILDQLTSISSNLMNSMDSNMDTRQVSQ